MRGTGGYSIGVDVGATNVKLVAVTPSGDMLDQRHFATHDAGASTAWADRIASGIETIESLRGVARSIGIAAPGLAAMDQQSIWWMHGRMEKLVNLDWTKHLRRARPVPVLNDAHAALLGEAWIGAARGCRNAAMLTLGTGVGGAILCDGRLIRGQIGRAGHLGHVVVEASGAKDIVNTPGSLEEAIGEYSLSARSAGKFTTTRDLLAARNAGDKQADQLWRTSILALAVSLAGIINVVDPEKIILGGGVAQAGEALFAPLREAMDQFEWRPHGHAVKIVAAALGDRAGALGAAWNAMNAAEETK